MTFFFNSIGNGESFDVFLQSSFACIGWCDLFYKSEAITRPFKLKSSPNNVNKLKFILCNFAFFNFF